MRFRRSSAAATRLTMRERQVMALLVRGATCADVAEQLGMGIMEVECHRAELITKLEAMAARDQASAGASGRFARAASMSASENSGSSRVPAR